MKGKQKIIVQNKKIKYEFELNRNITVIRGDSATGKTALVDMIREYYENGADSGVELNCKKTCVVLGGRNWKSQLELLADSIIFIDEGNAFVTSKEFAAAIQDTDNYYVIITRESLATLPYSVKEIYGIRNSGKYGQLKQTYNELYNIYGADYLPEHVQPKVVLVEDSNAGFQFFKDVCEKGNLVCISAEGKSNIFGLLGNLKDEATLIVADGAAFGAEMEKVMKLIEAYGNVTLFLPESFEWMVLTSGIIKDGELVELLANPSDYIDGKEYFSWERYFYRLLVEKTEGTYLKYSKSTLNPAYMQESVEKKILDTMEKIDFGWK